MHFPFAAVFSSSGPVISFRQGVDFRNTEAYVTDPANCVFNNTTTTFYPTTSPQGNVWGCESFNSGGGGNTTYNRNATVDPRLAGVRAFGGAGTPTIVYRFDVPPGSSVNVYLAIGDGGAARTSNSCDIQDGNTVVKQVMVGQSTAAGQWYDASGVLRTSAALWAANQQPFTFVCTTGIVRIHVYSSYYACAISHIFISIN